VRTVLSGLVRVEERVELSELCCDERGISSSRRRKKNERIELRVLTWNEFGKEGEELGWAWERVLGRERWGWIRTNALGWDAKLGEILLKKIRRWTRARSHGERLLRWSLNVVWCCCRRSGIIYLSSRVDEEPVMSLSSTVDEEECLSLSNGVDEEILWMSLLSGVDEEIIWYSSCRAGACVFADWLVDERLCFRQIWCVIL